MLIGADGQLPSVVNFEPRRTRLMDYQITCITPDGRDPGRRIDGVGGPWGHFSEDQAIAMIRAGHTFWTMVNWMRADVYIGGSALGTEYLTTSPDGYLPNNLLHLPPCW
jgi:hypothetical protein